MYKYLTTKNIENYKYSISVLKNKQELSVKDKEQIFNAEIFMNYSKYISRAYFGGELIRFLYKCTQKKINKLTIFAFLFLRVNIVWFSSNILTNLYLENKFKKLIQKHNVNKSEHNFKKFIEHKY
jgi:hypothetical protein